MTAGIWFIAGIVFAGIGLLYSTLMEIRDALLGIRDRLGRQMKELEEKR